MFDEQFTDRYMNLLLTMQVNSDVRILGFKEYLQLVEHGDYYYTSGDAVALYETGLEDVYGKLMRIRHGAREGKTRILHISQFLYYQASGKEQIPFPVWQTFSFYLQTYYILSIK